MEIKLKKQILGKKYKNEEKMAKILEKGQKMKKIIVYK